MPPAARVAAALARAGACALRTACSRDVEGKGGEVSAGGGPPAYGDTFIQASIGDISGLIPSLTSDASSNEIGGLIYDGLVRQDKDLNVVGAMAESWTFSKDCLELTFKLRRDVKWQDGQPVTAAARLLTPRTMIHPNTPA